MANPNYLLNKTGAEVDNILSTAESHVADSNKHVTSQERTNWNAAKTHADSAHAPSNAEANQNAFSNVAVGSTTIAADSKTDTLTLAGSNVTLTPDATNDKVTIGITQANVNSALGYTPANETTVSNLSNLVGTTAVSAQITNAITNVKGKASGLAELDSNGKVPSSQLPSYVDDVIEGYLSSSKFYTTKGSDGTYSGQITGETGKIYIDLNTNKTYRWSGSAYTVISETLAIGTTSSTAFRGDYGNTAYTHATAKGSKFDSGLYKITTNDQGHVTAATAVAKSDITSLGIPGQDTVYTHPTTSGNKHIPSGGSSGQILRWKADGEATWGSDNNTDTKVTAVGNHYTPSGGTTTSASDGTLTDITNSSSGVQVVTGVTKDAAGHVTGVTSVALKSVNTNTDTKNTTGSTDTSSKIYLVGATSQAANPQTYSDNQVYATNGQLDANKFRVAEKVTMQYDSTNECINFVFA